MSENSEHLALPENQIKKDALPLDDKKTILRYTPDTIRNDPRTGEPIKPLLFVQGISGGEVDANLPWTLEAFAQAEQRPIIAVSYTGDMEGTAKIVTVPGIDPEQNAVPEIDARQAEDLIKALDALGIDSVDAVGVSRGAVRLAVALATNPDRIDTCYLVHPAGQDNRNYRQTHIDAARQGISHAARKALGKIEAHETPDDLLEDKTTTRMDRLRRIRTEQKSVAGAILHNSLGEVADRFPDKHIIISGERHDKAFLSSRLKANRGNHVQFIETAWGNHGIGFNKKAVKEVSATLRQAETASTN